MNPPAVLSAVTNLPLGLVLKSREGHTFIYIGARQGTSYFMPEANAFPSCIGTPSTYKYAISAVNKFPGLSVYVPDEFL